MPGIDAHGIAETTDGFFKLFSQHILVTQQRIGIGEVGIELHGALKEADGRVVLLLQREAVAHCTPRLYLIRVKFNEVK